MADYYPLITKAVAGLDPGASGEGRRVLYERARAALLTQLRAVDPPFTEAEITRERLALEEAVRRVEGEATQRARDARVPTFSELVTDADEPGKAPSMVVTGGATGRLTRIWRCSMRSLKVRQAPLGA
jgi:predicted TIM-barrel enzyme